MNTDFKLGMIVSFDGEYGIVVKNDNSNPESCGIIRWDTAKENDYEDWTGLFGTFIQSGGKVITNNHKFKYINIDGTSKQ
jgi:hypothetical protein